MNFTDITGTTNTTSYFWMVAGPTSGIILLGIFAAVRLLRLRAEPVLDEEKGTTGSNTKASNSSRHSGWKRLIKVKRS
jgi:hypothetical protein